MLAGGETSATIGAAAARTNGTNTAMVYGTDGGIVAANCVVLEDDRHEQPIYAPVPVMREAVLKAYPQIAQIVKPLMQSLTRRRCSGSMPGYRSTERPMRKSPRIISRRRDFCASAHSA